MAKNKKDAFTSAGAHRLKALILRYWHDRGHKGVTVDVYEMGEQFPDMFGVRSNLVNGMPPLQAAIRRAAA